MVWVEGKHADHLTTALLRIRVKESAILGLFRLPIFGLLNKLQFLQQYNVKMLIQYWYTNL